MRKTIFLVLCVFFISFLGAELIDTYKRGEVRMQADSDFGVNTKWSMLFRSSDDGIAFLKDGNFYITAAKEHKVYKFDSNGELEFEFGKVGQGPGDLTNPGMISILDEKYLVVKERGNLRRISLFDLKGEFIKIIGTQNFLVDCISLKDKKIAFATLQIGSQNDIGFKKYKVFIKDIETGEENKIAEFQDELIQTKLHAADLYGEVFLKNIFDHDLLIGFSNSSELSIYSNKGEKISSFQVEDPKNQRKVTAGFISNYLDEVLMNQQTEKQRAMMERFIKNYKNQINFPKFQPFYYKMMVDSENNILLLPRGRDRNISIRIFSSAGKYICTTSLISDLFYPIYPHAFFNNYLYAWVQHKENEDLEILTRFSLK